MEAVFEHRIGTFLKLVKFDGFLPLKGSSMIVLIESRSNSEFRW